MSQFPIIDSLNKVHRLAKRATYDYETVYAIIDAAPICHVGFVHDGRPVVIPTIHARLDDRIFIHGAPASRMLKLAEGGDDVCLTFTLLDGLVLARSVFHSSMNYHSAVVFGKGCLVEEEAEKLQALAAVVEHVMPGRSGDARSPTPKEAASTTVIAITIETASAKIRTGGPLDDEEDYALPIWAGVVPLKLTPAAPLPDERLLAELPVPSYIQEYVHVNQPSLPSPQPG